MLVAVVTSLVLPSSAIAAPTPAPPPKDETGQVTLTDLGRADTLSKVGINEKGQVAGSSHGAALFSGGSTVSLHPSDANFSWADAVNDNGEVVGHFEKQDLGDEWSFLWKESEGGRPTNVFPLPTGRTINNKGQTAGGDWVRDPDGSLLRISAFKDQEIAINSLNESGSAAGTADMSPDPDDRVLRAFRTRPGEILDVNRDRLQYKGDRTYAYDVNDKGQAAGYGVDEGGGYTPLVWEPGGTPRPMTTPYGGQVRAINNAGVAIGVMSWRDPVRKSYWDKAAVYLDGVGTYLNDLKPAEYTNWDLQMAWDVNESGQIAGIAYVSGQEQGNQWRAYVLDLGSLNPAISSMTVETKTYPSDDWDAPPSEGVTDGNPVRASVSMSNPADRPIAAELRLSYEASSGKRTPIPGGKIDVTLPPHETVKEQVVWDTTGAFWEKAGLPADVRTVKAEIVVGGVTRHSAGHRLSMRPKPVVLVHGYKSDQQAWDEYKSFLSTRTGTLKGYAVGDGQVPGTLSTGSLSNPLAATLSIKENAEQEALYIEGVRRKTGAFHVDVIAHSMGGLITRQYVHSEMPDSPDGKPVVSRMMQMGTPNRGSPCADMLMDLSALQGLPVPLWPATLQLSVPYMREVFNPAVTDLKGVTVSNLVGVGNGVPCFTFEDGIVEEDGDSIVPESSAQFTYTDIPYTRTLHTDMTESQGDFLSYAYPRLASVLVNTGNPGGVEPLAKGAAAEPGGKAATARSGESSDAKAAADDSAAGAAGAVSAFAAPSASVEAGKTATVPLDVPPGTGFGVTGVLPPTVGLALRDPAGRVAAQYAAGSDGAKQPIQGLSVSKPLTGRWKLEITNSGTETVEAALAAWVAGNPVTVTATAGQSSQDGRTQVKAVVTDAGQPVTGAAVRAVLTAQDATHHELTLRDDGNSGDGGDGDGVYGAVSDPLADGAYGIAVRADTPKGTRTARETVQIKQIDTREYALTLSARPGGSVSASPAQDTYRAGAEVTVTADADAGRIPLGWTLDGEERPAGALRLIMNRAHTVVARFGSYTVTEIGGLPGGLASATQAVALNDRGQVAATAKDKDQKLRAVRWQDGAFTDLGGLECTETDGSGKTTRCEAGATGINEAGDVSGWAYRKVDGNLTSRALVYRGEALTQLQPESTGSAVDLNDSGQVFGVTNDKYVMWDQGSARRLPDTPQFSLGTADTTGQINDAGIVAGAHVTNWDALGTPTGWHPAVYRDGVTTPLVIPACRLDGGLAHDVNATGLVVGEGLCNTGSEVTHHAYTWKDGRRTDLGEGQAIVVNNYGLVGGFSGAPSLTTPTLWLDGHRYDLRDLLPLPSCKAKPGAGRPCMDLSALLDVNSSGQILAKGVIRDHGNEGYEERERSFLLTPSTARADLELTHTVSAVEPGPGSTVTWTSTVTNHGPDTAIGVLIDVNVPQAAGPTTCETSRGMCVELGISDQVKIGSLPSGATATVEVNATIPAATAEGTELISRAVVSSFEVADPEPADNTAEITATVRHALSTTAINWPDPVRVGASSYEGKVTLTNRGNKDMPITVIQTEGPFEQTNNCPVKLAPNATCVVSARFVPTRVGEANGKLTFTTDGTGPAHTVTLTGHGSQANARPVLEEPTAPLRATVGQPLSLRIHFTDADRADTHTAQVEWSEPPVPAEVTQHEGGGIVTASKIFTEAREGVLAVLVTDSKGDTAERYIDYVIEEPTPNTAPTLSVGADIELSIGENLQRTISFTDPDSTTWNASADYGDGSGPAPVTVTNRQITLQHRWTNAGTYPVIVTVRDDGGLQTSATFTTTITTTPTPNQAPTVKLTGPDHITEGTTWQATASFTDPDSTTWNASADYGDGSGPVPLPLDGKKLDLKHTATDNGERTITVTVTDDKGATATTTLPLTITNAAPQVSLTDPPLDTIVSIDTPITLKASFTDPGTADTHTATWTVNGQQLPATLTEHNGHGTATRSHVFTKAGRYPISVTVTDDDTTATTTDTIGDQKASIIVYDPATSVVGAGLTPSPAGSCQLNTGCAKAGMAAFTLVARYLRRTGAPTGVLTYDAPGFSLRDTSYTVLAAADGGAILRGTGRVNTVTKVTFEVTAVDSGKPLDRADRLRLKVWRENGELIYDNQRTGLESIVIGVVRISG
ncbi:PKD domain-containing protein [Streptosporangium sp. V21-05]|uniref:PKD domain-containing protein n=1 Tax=Streptosporangium sp. V21-05 TaxID=3446115 RepID=UPI003F52AC85